MFLLTVTALFVLAVVVFVLGMKTSEGFLVFLGSMFMFLVLFLGYGVLGVDVIRSNEEYVKHVPEEVLIGERVIVAYDNGKVYMKNLASDLVDVKSGGEVFLSQKYGNNAYGYRITEDEPFIVIVKKEKE